MKFSKERELPTNWQQLPQEKTPCLKYKTPAQRFRVTEQELIAHLTFDSRLGRPLSVLKFCSFFPQRLHFTQKLSRVGLNSVKKAFLATLASATF